MSATPKSGDLVEIDYTREGDHITDLTLLGPARHVCEGVLEYGAAT